MRILHGRVGPLVAALTLMVTTTACTAQSPASTHSASTPASLFPHETVAGAWKIAVERRRPMVVMFTSDACPHCERMLAETYADPAISTLLAKYAETALAHAADNRELVKRLGIRGYPTSIIVSAEGQIVDAVEGFLDAPTFARRVARWVGPHAESAQLAPTSAVAR